MATKGRGWGMNLCRNRQLLVTMHFVLILTVENTNDNFQMIGHYGFSRKIGCALLSEAAQTKSVLTRKWYKISLNVGIVILQTCDLVYSPGLYGFHWSFLMEANVWLTSLCCASSARIAKITSRIVASDWKVERYEPVREKNQQFGVPTRSDTNRTVQSQKMVRGLKFWL